MGYFSIDESLSVPASTPETPYPRSAKVISGLRYLHPTLGRWLARDPLDEQGGINVYLFLQNSPITGVDPFGMYRFPDVYDVIRILTELKHRWDVLQEAAAKVARCAETISDVTHMFGTFDNDKYAHCLASCRISKDCSVSYAVYLGAAKEFRDMLAGYLQRDMDSSRLIPQKWKDWMHEHLQGGTPMDSAKDTVANISGYACRYSIAGCEACCKCRWGDPYTRSNF